MRIYGPNGTTLGSPASNTRRTSSSGFVLPERRRRRRPAPPPPPKAAGNIDGLLALQGIEEDPVERRKRSVVRGRARSTCSTISRWDFFPASSTPPP